MIYKIYNKIKKGPAPYEARGFRSGYTVIETMIAASIFTIIMTFGLSALLNANFVHQKSQDMRSILDSLSFITEEIARNIRTGYNYRCINDGNYSTEITTTKSCSLGAGIAFESAFGDSANVGDQWVYKIESNNLSKSINSASTWTVLNPTQVVLNPISGFSVLGAEIPPGNTQQPLMIIKLVGTITYKNISSPFSRQTAVSQRLVDLE